MNSQILQFEISRTIGAGFAFSIWQIFAAIFLWMGERESISPLQMIFAGKIIS